MKSQTVLISFDLKEKQHAIPNALHDLNKPQNTLKFQRFPDALIKGQNAGNRCLV